MMKKELYLLSCVLLVSDHPNKEQYDQYEQQWRQYEEQMSQKREYIQSRKRALLESQQQGQAAAAASQPAMPQLGSSFAASVTSSATPASFSAPPSVSASAAYTSAMYGASVASSQPMQSAYPYPDSAAGQAFPVSTPGYGSHMPPFQPAAPFSPAVPTGAGGQRLPAMSHDSSAFPPSASGPRPGFPGTRPPFDVGQTPAVDPSKNQKVFEEYGDGKDNGTGSQFLQGARPPSEAVGGRPPFGQRLSFRGPRPGVPNEFGVRVPFQTSQSQASIAPNEFAMQAPFQQSQPRAGIRPTGPRLGFGPRHAMYPESEESSPDVGDVTESDDQTSGMPSQFGPGLGGPGFGRGVRPFGPGMGPRAGFPPGPRPMGMMPRQQVPAYLEEANEDAEESGEWLGDEMQATSGADFAARGMRLEGPRFPIPVSGFAGQGDVRGPPPQPTDPWLMLRPSDPRAAFLGGLRPRCPGPRLPWLFASGRGVPQWEQDFVHSAAEEEYDENAEVEEGVEEDTTHEEGFGEEFEGDQNFEQGDEGFGNMAFGPHGFPLPPFGGRPPGFGMERPRLDMRGPRPGFGPRGPGFGLAAGLRPRGPVPLMAIQLPPLYAAAKSKEQSDGAVEGEENVENEETEEFTEESDQFAEQADAASGMGARMPFRPPFPPAARGFPADQRLRPPGSMLGAPPRAMAGLRGGRWPQPGFGERFPPPGFRGPMPRFPRMPGPQFGGDLGEEYGPEGFEDTGFGEVPEEDYLAAEAQQWGEQQMNKDGQSMEPGNANDMSAGTER